MKFYRIYICDKILHIPYLGVTPNIARTMSFIQKQNNIENILKEKTSSHFQANHDKEPIRPRLIAIY